MSIHRPKRATYRKADEARDVRSNSQGSKLPAWEEAVADQPDDTFVSYAPAAALAVSTLVSHAKFGKGVVVGVEPGKVSILFEQGVKKLLHTG